jgi:membrane protein implicated in regulation of membrane protease activity
MKRIRLHFTMTHKAVLIGVAFFCSTALGMMDQVIPGMAIALVVPILVVLFVLLSALSFVFLRLMSNFDSRYDERHQQALRDRTEELGLPSTAVSTISFQAYSYLRDHPGASTQQLTDLAYGLIDTGQIEYGQLSEFFAFCGLAGGHHYGQDEDGNWWTDKQKRFVNRQYRAFDRKLRKTKLPPLPKKK